MTFDRDTEEKARALDAIDRLRIVQVRLAEKEPDDETRLDFILRMMAVVAIAWLVYFAFHSL